MRDHVTSLATFDDLRHFVKETLCAQELLKHEEFELVHEVLRRGPRPCGVYFSLQGPRALCLSAVWETERNTILFYGSSGERVQRTQLTRAPRIDELTVAA
jgi:hypothetical protein